MKEFKKYIDALQSGKLDSSEWIMLVIAYIDEKLQKQPNESLHLKLNFIRLRFAILDYETVKREIRDYFDFFEKNEKMKKIFLEPIPLLRDNPEENHNRRFFETRLAKCVLSDMEKNGNHLGFIELFTVMQSIPLIANK